MEKRLRFGVLSTARIGLDRFIPAASVCQLGEVVAIASRDIAKAHDVAQRLGIRTAHGSYEALLADPQVEAVYVSLPNRLHRDWTIKAAQAGKHVICEKPVARHTADAIAMADAAKAAKVLYMEAFMYRHHPQHDRVKTLLSRRLIGEPHVVRATFSFFLRQAQSNIRSSAALDGGSLMDVGCYAVNVCRFIFDAEPTEVIAMQRLDTHFGVDMSFGGLLRFPGDRLGIIDSSFDVNGGGKYEVLGPYGNITVNRAFTPGDDPCTIGVQASGPARVEEIAGTNQYALQIDHFARSVAQGELLSPAEDGVANTRVVEALYTSAEQGIAVRL